MNLYFTSLLALLAAAMFPLQLPICMCAGNGHSHSSEQQAQQHHHANTAAESDGDSHEGHFHEADHSYHRVVGHRAGHAQSVAEPAPDGHGDSDSHSCQCAPQNVPSVPVPKGTSVESPFGHLHRWLGPVLATCVEQSTARVNSLVEHMRFWHATNLSTISQGNPCALFCRWLI